MVIIIIVIVIMMFIVVVIVVKGAEAGSCDACLAFSVLLVLD